MLTLSHFSLFNKKFSIFICFVLSLVVFLTSCNSVSSTTSATKKATTLSNEEIYTKAAPSTVEITTNNSNYSSTATGFFYDTKGTVITNYHVIDGAKKAKIKTHDNIEYDVLEILGYNKTNDIAVLSTSCTSSTPLTKSDSSVVTGQKIYALGSSLGLTNTFSEGIISSSSRNIDGTNYIQITAPISQGNSGGPLLDEYGKIIGITTAGFVDGQNLNLAVPIEAVDKIPKNLHLSLERHFSETPAIKRVFDFLSYSGNQEVRCSDYITFNIMSVNDAMLIFWLTTWSTPSNKQSFVEITMFPKNNNSCSIYYYNDLNYLSANGRLDGVPLSSISNSSEMHRISINLNSTKIISQAENLLMQQQFNHELAELVENFNEWLITNNIPCGIEDFGFYIN